MFLKKLLTTALVASSLVFAGASVAAPIVIKLNPSAPNGAGLPTIDDAGTITPTISVDNITGSLLSTLNIFGSSAVAGSNPTGWVETGILPVTAFLLNSVNQDTTLGVQYHIYATFTATGFGAWFGAGNYGVLGVNSLNVSLWASPDSSDNPTYSATGVVSNIGGDFLLGSAAFADDGTTQGSATLAGFNGANVSGAASTSLSAGLKFTVASPDLEGVGGFFEAPYPFEINLGSQSGSNGLQSTWAWNKVTDVVSVITGAGVQRGTSSLTPVSRIPEPGVLALVGVGLVGVAATRRRKLTKA